MRCGTCDRERSYSSYTPSEFVRGPGRGICKDCTHRGTSSTKGYTSAAREHTSATRGYTPARELASATRGYAPSAREHTSFARRHPSSAREYTSSATEYDSGRYNEASTCNITYDALKNPFASGSFRWVAKGVYASGPRRGRECVVKWFKESADLAHDYFSLDIKAVDKALEIVNQFNKSGIIDKVIKINIPEVWRFGDRVDSEFAGQKYLCEPYIENYEKFNSNTGWHDSSTKWGQAMQALSHFSYYISRGELLLCDLQGGIYKHDAVLTDPVILSRSKKYGVTDLGFEGMKSFFAEHRCNGFCNPNWPLPSRPNQRFQPIAGTSMVKNMVPTRYSRAAAF